MSAERGLARSTARGHDGRLSRWASAHYGTLLSDRYVPLLYTAKGKRPGQRYLLHHVLLEDVALLVLAFGWLMEHPVRGSVGLVLLHLSFWLVYEIGYHENDHLATKREVAPNIPSGSVAYGDRMRPRLAWATSLVVAVPGVALLAGSNNGSLSLLGFTEPGLAAVAATWVLWALYLVASRAMFWVYNRSSVTSRGLLYVGLQLFRTLGYVLVLSTSLAGAMALTALALARWVPYLTYREVGIHWHSSYRVILLFMFLIAGAAVSAVEPSSFLRPQAAVVTLWLVVLARKPLLALVTPRA